MKRALLGLLLLALGLAAVVLLRTVLVGQPLPPAVGLPPPQVDPMPAARRLATTLTFRTIAQEDPSRTDPAPFLAMQASLERFFPLAHQHLGLERVGDVSLLYTWSGSEPSLPPLLLLAHLDVVPADPRNETAWTYPPFAGTVADGFVWGRGAMDMKMTVLGVLEAVESLLAEGFRPRRTVILAFGHDEEVGGAGGARALAETLHARGVTPALILDEGMAIVEGAVPGVSEPVALVGIAEKGYLSVELAAEGQGGHSSMPPAETAVGVVASAVDALQTHPMPPRLEGPARLMLEALAPQMPFVQRLVIANLWLFEGVVTSQLDRAPATRALIRTTLAPTLFEGSIQENVLPTRARAVVNARIHPAERSEDVLAHVRHVVSDPRVTVRSVGDTISEPSATAPVESPAFDLVRASILEAFPDVTVAPTLTLGATDSRHYAGLGAPTYRFVPLRLTLEDTVRIHGIDERIAVANYGEAIAFYVGLIRRADTAATPGP